MSKANVETPRRLASLSQNSPSSTPPLEDGQVVEPVQGYVMPTPLLPFVKFKFSQTDEPAYGIILRRGDRSLDLGVFAANHRTIQQKDGVRHADDPDLARMAEYLPGIWENLPEAIDLVTRLEILEEYVAAQKPKPAGPV